MTAVDTRIAIRPVMAPALWSGRVLSGVIGGFLAVEGLSRLFQGVPLVAASETALPLAASVQTGLGAALALGAGLLGLAWTRLGGTILLTACLCLLLATEAQSDAPSAAHALFWAYVAGLLWTGTLLRRLRVGAP